MGALPKIEFISISHLFFLFFSLFFFEKAGRDLKKFLNSLKCFIIIVVRRPLNGLELSFQLNLKKKAFKESLG